jgi:rhodanese-related sulfurtransferase
MRRAFKTYIFFSLLIGSLWAGVENSYPTQQIINSGIKIVDIRTEGEWKQTGILKGSYPITFFQENGSYNVREFLSKLNSVVNRGEKFAIICRTGSRTKAVSGFLGRNGYDVVNLVGGILHATKRLGIQTVPYRGN